MMTTLARIAAPKGRLPRAKVPQINQTQTDDIPMDVRAFVGCRFLRLGHGRFFVNFDQANISI